MVNTRSKSVLTHSFYLISKERQKVATLTVRFSDQRIINFTAPNMDHQHCILFLNSDTKNQAGIMLGHHLRFVCLSDVGMNVIYYVLQHNCDYYVFIIYGMFLS